MGGMVKRFVQLVAVAALTVPGVQVGALPAKPVMLAASHAITPGSWNIAFDDGTARRMCLDDAQPLLQLAHAGPICGRLVIENQPNSATVHYTCPGAGWGRTSLLIETPRLVQINSQGVVNRMPFAFTAEARRIGECETSAQHRQH